MHTIACGVAVENVGKNGHMRVYFPLWSIKFFRKSSYCGLQRLIILFFWSKHNGIFSTLFKEPSMFWNAGTHKLLQTKTGQYPVAYHDQSTGEDKIQRISKERIADDSFYMWPDVFGHCKVP